MIQCQLTNHREKINTAVLQANKNEYNKLVDTVKKIDVEHRELSQHNTQVSEKIAPSAENLELKLNKRATLKSQLEKCINEMVNLPSVQGEKMVIRFRFRCDKNSELQNRTSIFRFRSTR